MPLWLSLVHAGSFAPATDAFPLDYRVWRSATVRSDELALGVLLQDDRRGLLAVDLSSGSVTEAGAQMASFISYVEPGQSSSDSIPLLAVEGGADICGSDSVLAGTQSQSADYYPQEYDDHTTFPPCGEASSCPTGTRFVVGHADDASGDKSGKVIPFLPWADTALDQVGISMTAFDGTYPSTPAPIPSASVRTWCPPITPCAQAVEATSPWVRTSVCRTAPRTLDR